MKTPTRDEVVARERESEHWYIWELYQEPESSEDGGWYIDGIERESSRGGAQGFESKMGTHMRSAPRPPVKGDRVKVWGAFGSRVKGMDLLVDGEWTPCWWSTDEEQRLESAKWQADYKRSQVEDYEKERPALDQLFDELPPDLQRRIQRFRDKDPNFRWEGEAYEMAACAEAGRLYKRALDPEWGEALKAAHVYGPTESAKQKKSYEWNKTDGTLEWEDTPENRLWAFDSLNSKLNDYQYEKMTELMPEMDDGHSGNTWSHAFVFALRLVRGEGDKL